MRQDLWQCPGLPEACLSPPVPRDHKEQALPSCSRCCLTSLLRSHHLSLAWVPTSLILGVWDPASGPRHPQGPPCHTVTALLRDQDKVLLLAPVSSHGTHAGEFRHHPGQGDVAPRARRGASSWGYVGWFCCPWQLILFWTLHSPLRGPPETTAGARFDFLG